MRLTVCLFLLVALATLTLAQQNTGSMPAQGTQQGAAKKAPLSPPGQAHFEFADGKGITVDYSRPSIRNRKIMGGLVPYGQVWRTGANAATTFVTTTPLVFGGKTLPAGKYTMYTIPGETQWTIIINGQTGQWGTTYNEAQDVLRVMASPRPIEPVVDPFTISFEKKGPNAGLMLLQWENTSVPVEFSEGK